MTAVSIGLLTAEPSALFCDLAVATPAVDFVVLDAEGTGLGVRDCADAARILQSGRLEVHVRVPSLDPGVLLAYANTGVDELLLPQVEEVRDIERALEAVTFGPRGGRPRQVVRSSAYGSTEGRVPRLSAIIETVAAFDAAEAFSRVDAVETFWIGLTDLSDDMARHRRAFGGSDEETANLISRLRGRCNVGLPAASEEGVMRAQRLNVQRCAVYWERLAAATIASVAAAGALASESGTP